MNKNIWELHWPYWLSEKNLPYTCISYRKYKGKFKRPISAQDVDAGLRKPLNTHVPSHQAYPVMSCTYATSLHALQGGRLITMSEEMRTCSWETGSRRILHHAEKPHIDVTIGIKDYDSSFIASPTNHHPRDADYLPHHHHHPPTFCPQDSSPD